MVIGNVSLAVVYKLRAGAFLNAWVAFGIYGGAAYQNKFGLFPVFFNMLQAYHSSIAVVLGFNHNKGSKNR